MKYLLLIALIAVSIIMIVLGTKADMLPPILTGVGFILIAGLFLTNRK
jgi:preprotein translocase subunit SecD